MDTNGNVCDYEYEHDTYCETDQDTYTTENDGVSNA